MFKNKSVLFLLSFLVACGGGGGGGGGDSTPSTPAPSVTFSASATDVLLNTATTLTWSSSNATSCTASGTWSGSKGTSGSEDVTITNPGSNTFTLACSGAGGTTTRSLTVTGYRNFEGRVVDGYISGASVFIDANNNYTADASETTVSTASDGAFTLRYSDGSLVSIGGADADTQNQLDNLLLMHKMAGHTDLKIVSPVTTVAAFMEDPTQINAVLGLDASIDITAVDPVANKGDGGIYDQLYEAGNKLTVLALSLQGITNNLNSTSETTQDYFKAITEEIAKEYAATGTKVDIATASFVTKVLDNVSTAKTLTLSESAKDNTITALSSTLQLVQVKSDATVTTGIISFATSNLLTDIVSIANGTASEELIANYTTDLINYVATTENIDSNTLTPDITAVADSATTTEDTAVIVYVLLNDTYNRASPISLSAGNPTNGSTSVADGAITYTPNADYNGTDAFTYTITQGDKTSSADVSLTIEAVNDAPTINLASILYVPEGQIEVASNFATDIDSTDLVLSITGVDKDSFTTNDTTNLFFKNPPVYEEKNSYSITIELSDKSLSVTKDLTINIQRVFTGNAIDGYLSGAKVFIDQNFNFTFDAGELSATTQADGSFNIVVPENLYTCLVNRPIGVDVPIGAVDSARGEILKPFQMMMPSIKDSGSRSIVISPFTNLLSNTISKAKADVELVEDLTLAEGCGTKGDAIATKISAEVKQLTDTIESSTGVSYKNLLTDFVASSPNALITTSAAESLADYLPYFKIASDEIDKELSDKYGIDINTNLTIQRETVQNILANSPDSIELNFYTIYKDKPNALGWFLQDSVEARKGILNRNGELVHAECIGGDSGSCKTTNFSLEAIKNASNWYMKRSDLINESYKLNDDNWQLNYEESMYVTYNPDGSVNQRRCNDQNWLYLQPKFQEDNRVRNDRYNTGYAYGGSGFDSCAVARTTGITEVNQSNPSIPSNALFLALVETWTNPQNQLKEEFDIRLTNSNFSSSKFLTQKLDNIFEKRSTLNIDPLVQEIKSIPRSLQGIDSIRAKVIPGSGDQLTIYFTKRNESSQQTNSYNLSIGELRSSDTFQEYSYTNSSSGSSSQKVSEISGFNALTAFRNALIDNSEGFNNTKYSGTINTLKGKAIDGYISGAEIFIDKNFNFVKDADEYSTTTGSDGSFVLDIFGSAYACLLERPIVANVPVGAVDSSLGTVTSAYRMILPSIKDSGSSKVFITPFTTILSDAILRGKQESAIKDEVSPQDACATKGNQVAAKISEEIVKIKNLIQDTYGVTYETVLGDFIENGASGVVSEASAQNIATFLRPLKLLQDNVSSSMTASLNLPITANISLDKSVIDTIFSGNALQEIPLNFYSVYTTEPNDLGWRREVSFKADGAKVLSDGTLKAYKCLNNPSSDCVSSTLSLDKLSIFSNSYRQTVGFYYGLGTGDQVTIGKATGLMAVDASDVKAFFVSEGQDRFSCSTEEQIQLRGNAVDNVSWEYKYQTNYNEYNTDLNGCRNSQVSNVVPARRGSIEILRKDSANNIDIATTYVIPDMENTSLFSTNPKKLIENFETIDPKSILTEIASFPDNYYQADYAKGLLGANEQIQYNWAERYPSGDFKTQYNLKVYPASNADGKTYELTVSNYEDGTTSPVSSSNYSGNDALTNFNNHLSSLNDSLSTTFYTNPLVLVADAITLAEDSVLSFNPLENDTIPSGAGVTLSATTPTNGSIAISGNTITYTPTANFFGEDTFTYTVVSNNISVSAAVSVQVTSVNDLPNINNTASSYSFNENATSAVLTVDASDIEGESLSYSVTGTDAAKFSISSAGALTFSASPDYESPQDSDTNNVYELNLVVSDASGSTTKAITVTVINVPDLVSGVAVDGYVAGATVFQDLNNDGDLDAGEPNTATNALGQFSLTLSSVATNAPVRILNGYDLATNEVLPSILDISATEAGSYVVTPISTLIGRLKISDSALTTSIAEEITASALGINLSDAPNGSVLGFDPIAYFTGSDTDLAAKARPVFANNQLLMAIGGANYSSYNHVLNSILSALSTTLTTAAGQSVTLSAANDSLTVKQKAYDAVFDAYVDTLLAWNPPLNGMQFKSNKAVLTDYIDGSADQARSYSLYGEYVSGKFKADLSGATLDKENLQAIVTNSGSGNPMDLSFELSNLPTGSGSTPVTLRMFHGSDTAQADDEDYFEISLTAEWSSDGTTMSISLPSNATLTGKFFDRGGTVLTKTYTNQAADLFTVDQEGPNRPASLSIRLSRLFDLFPLEREQLGTFLDYSNTFTYQVVLGSFNLFDHFGNSFSEIYGTFGVGSTASNVIFADDIKVNENGASKTIAFYQPSAQSVDVTIDYAVASSSTASVADHTLTSGTITIPAGSLSTNLSIPIVNDEDFEAQETLTLSLSNPSNAVLGRSSVNVLITDGEKILSNASQKSVLVNNIYNHSQKFISDYIKNKLDTQTITISGQTVTLAQLMLNESVTTDVYKYIDDIATSYEPGIEGIIGAALSKADSYITTQLSSFSSYDGFARALTQIIAGIKSINVGAILGTNINQDGSFPAGQDATTLAAATETQIDTLITLASDTVADVLGSDTSTNFPNANVIIGTDGDDTLTGTAGSDLIATFSGADTVNAGAGNDKILGGPDIDTLNGEAGNDHIYGYAGNDVLSGGDGNDKILGGLGNDTIRGGAGDDDLRGEAGDDTIYSGTGSDTINGGLGNDTIYIDGM